MGSLQSPISSGWQTTDPSESGHISILNQRIGARLAAKRNAESLDLQSLSNLCGLDMVRLAEIETGLMRPKAAELYEITAALGMQLSELFIDL